MGKVTIFLVLHLFLNVAMANNILVCNDIKNNNNSPISISVLIEIVSLNEGENLFSRFIEPVLFELTFHSEEISKEYTKALEEFDLIAKKKEELENSSETKYKIEEISSFLMVLIV